MKLDSIKQNIIKKMLAHLGDPRMRHVDVMLEASPIISFGDFTKSRIATLGLNPSNKEFQDASGDELTGSNRRFHTLSSLDLPSWNLINSEQLVKILQSCENYFLNNPYDRWFKVLNHLISGTGYSYYDSFFKACHLDLVPYATTKKWGELSNSQKAYLLDIGTQFLAEIIKYSEIDIIILNGKSVLLNFETIADVKLEAVEVNKWRLPRKNGFVPGISYTGTIEDLQGIKFNRKIFVVGFNHNIQSSFGVTSEVKSHIRTWITRKVSHCEK